MRTLLSGLLLALVLLVLPAPAQAQDAQAADLERRIEMIRKMDPATQKRLRAALQRFKQLDDTQKQELRRRAKKVGEERLRVLAERDVAKVKKKHAAIESERQAIRRYIGEERLAALTPLQRRYVEAHATRRFQSYMKRQLLSLAGPGALEDFQALPPADRRNAIRAAMRKVEAALLEEQPVQYRERLATATPRERKRAMKEIVRDYRRRSVARFVQFFDHAWLTPYLALSPELRTREAERWAERERWFEMRRVLEREIKISDEHRRMLRGLRAGELARLRDLLQTARDLPPDERRLRFEEEIARLDGQAAVDRERKRNAKRDLKRRMRNKKKRDR